jgi:small multidrug resistance pump
MATVTTWLLLLGAVVSEVAGSLSLKGAAGHPAFFAVVAIGYAVAFALLVAVLRRGMSLGAAYGIWGALGIAFTAVLSTIIFHEPFTLLMSIGLVLVVAGVLLVESKAHGANSGDD